MNENGSGPDRAGRQLVADAISARKRAQFVSGLRGLARPSPPQARPGNGGPPGATAPDGDPGAEHCDLCGITVPADHRHLLDLAQRRIVCSCEACWAMRSGEGDYRPVGNRTVWLPDLDLPDDVWAGFQIPIGLAFFMQSTVTSCVVAMYPSPAGATESELHFESWSRMCELNPILADLEPDIEGLIVNRLSEPPMYVIAPIDRCYGLTGAVKATWEGISGGAGVDRAVTRFFERLRAKAVAA
ncbi:MAG TPA: DUF5947 family protein [Solirubrobacteraceae bacterium]